MNVLSGVVWDGYSVGFYVWLWFCFAVLNILLMTEVDCEVSFSCLWEKEAVGLMHVVKLNLRGGTCDS